VARVEFGLTTKNPGIWKLLLAVWKSRYRFRNGLVYLHEEFTAD
jgi:hypothetical protein